MPENKIFNIILTLPFGSKTIFYSFIKLMSSGIWLEKWG